MSVNKLPKYVIITPVRNEEKYIEKTIQSVINQNVQPYQWIIVNDGSTDGTGQIIDAYTRQCSWIYLVHRDDRGFRKSGGGVIEAFYEGYNILNTVDWDYIVKLDGDLSFDPEYFQRCFKYFENNLKLGVGGGVIYNLINGKWELERHPRFHVRGATKIYKKECWNSIAGLIQSPGWDTLDEVKANMLGWQTQSFFDLKVLHYRKTGSADGAWRNFVKNGLANYISGYHPFFMISKCLKRVFQKPYVIASIGLFYGFISGYIKNVPQVNDKDLISYLRKQQLSRLLLKESIWK
jgi:biofilm PGA synthesis N-glycosyltransferase PgaC